MLVDGFASEHRLVYFGLRPKRVKEKIALLPLAGSGIRNRIRNRIGFAILFDFAPSLPSQASRRASVAQMAAIRRSRSHGPSTPPVGTGKPAAPQLARCGAFLGPDDGSLGASTTMGGAVGVSVFPSELEGSELALGGRISGFSLFGSKTSVFVFCSMSSGRYKGSRTRSNRVE